jgi:hypothetical protein
MEEILQSPLERLFRKAIMSVIDSKKDQAVEKIIRFIQSVEMAPAWETWRVGIANDPTSRLLNEHKAIMSKSIVVPVDSPATAHSAIKYLVERYGMDGIPESNENPFYVYAFKKAFNTDPPVKG